MSPEGPYVMAGGIALATGVAREGGFPKEGVKALMGTVALMIVASATANTPLAPVMRALGFLFLMAAVMAAVNTYNERKK